MTGRAAPTADMRRERAAAQWRSRRDALADRIRVRLSRPLPEDDYPIGVCSRSRAEYLMGAPRLAGGYVATYAPRCEALQDAIGHGPYSGRGPVYLVLPATFGDGRTIQRRKAAAAVRSELQELVGCDPAVDEEIDGDPGFVTALLELLDLIERSS